MWQKTLKQTLIIGIAASFGLAGFTGCDDPEEGAQPAAEAEAPQAPDQQPGDDDQAPDLQQPPGADDDQMAIDGPQPGQQPPGMDGEVSDEELDNFGEAIESIQELEEEGPHPQDRMAEADSPQEAQQIQQEIMGEMQDAVEESGMEFTDFMMLVQRMQHDPELQQRLSERVDIEGMGQPQQAPAPGGAQPGGQQPAPAPAPVEEAPADLDGEMPDEESTAGGDDEE